MACRRKYTLNVGAGTWSLTQYISRLVPGYEAGIIPVTHPFLQDPLAKVLSEAAARRDQAIVSAVCLRESAQDSPGNNPAIGKYR